MSLPLKVILKELESTPTSVIPILTALHRNKSLLQNISKQDRKHLVSRCLNLTRSPQPYSKWCGVNLLFVLSNDYTVLTEDGVNFISQLMKIIEQQNSANSLFVSAVECLNKVCAQIRGKPTLTREILTPKLPQIISLYMEVLEFAPLLIIGSLKRIMKNHPTTFRPYGNKLRAKLNEFIVGQSFINFPQELKQTIYSTLASLPIIEKTEPEKKWQDDVKNLTQEIIQIALIYREFMNFNDDEELRQMIQKVYTGQDKDASASTDLVFAPLNVDVNDSKSFFSISERLSVLCQLLGAFLQADTPFAVRVPIGLILTMCDIICSINTRFISFRNDTHDSELKETIKLTLFQNQNTVTQLLSILPGVYRGSVLSHLSNVLSLLEVLIPFSNRRIDSAELFNNEQFMSNLLVCVTNWLNLTSSYGDATQLLRFIEVALILVEPQQENIQDNQKNSNNNSNGAGKKNKNKKKNTSSVPLSDLLSHQHLFSSSVSASTISVIRKFINAALKKCNIPPTQYYKILKYVVVEATRARAYSLESEVPVELTNLLVDAVLYPGNENVSILPIVSSILGNSPIISVFNNPRFPQLAKYSKVNQISFEEEEEEDEDGEEDETETAVPSALGDVNDRTHQLEETEEIASKRQKFQPSSTFTVSAASIAPSDELVFKETVTKTVTESVTVEEPSKQVDEVVAEAQTTEPTFNPFTSASAATTSAAPAADDDNSDFEIPNIDIDDDDDDDE